MTGADLITLLPMLILAATPVALLLLLAWKRSERAAFSGGVIGLAASLAALVTVPGPLSPNVTALFVFDGYARFFFGLLAAGSLAVLFLARGYWKKSALRREEFYVLLLLAALGSVVLAASTHFASFFLGLELLSVSLYAMIAYPRLHGLSLEAGVKYLVPAASASAFLLFGMALVYAATGSMAFALPAAEGIESSLLLTGGLVLIVVGVGFKLAVVPFHLWTPDVYQGAPAPVAAFIASVSKGAVLALVLRLFGGAGAQWSRPFGTVFTVITGVAIASMVFGTLLALLQENLKRLLAYSSIAHLGFLLVALLAGGEAAFTAIAFYLVAYFVTIIGAFGVITVLSQPGADTEALEDYRGLFWTRPWLAGTLAAMMLSLAGIPLTAGFIAKFTVVFSGVHSRIWVPVLVLVATSAVGLYYYLRVLVTLYASGESRAGAAAPVFGGGAVLAVLALLLLFLGVLPGPLVNLIRAMLGAAW
jgi:NADH-quinone oxidoreductase subunit N